MQLTESRRVLISVIIPIFNVEKYLRKSLNSILNQTYTNLEIILIDDGSTDSSGRICDEYAANDARIKVIHQINKGVAAARNIGLDNSSGSYIAWVDPDDWIESDMLEYMFSNGVKQEAEITVCGRYEEFPARQVKREWNGFYTFDNLMALEKLLENDQMQNFLWDKLWKAELFEGIRFPEGRTYEDISIMHRLFERADKIVCLPEAKYHYLQRNTSIVADVSLGNRINHFIASKQRYEEMRGAYPQFEKKLEGQCIASAVGIWCCYMQNKADVRKRYNAQLSEISDYAKMHFKSSAKYMKLGLAGQIVMRLVPHKCIWAFIISSAVSKLYEKRNGKKL